MHKKYFSFLGPIIIVPCMLTTQTHTVAPSKSIKPFQKAPQKRLSGFYHASLKTYEPYLTAYKRITSSSQKDSALGMKELQKLLTLERKSSTSLWDSIRNACAVVAAIIIGCVAFLPAFVAIMVAELFLLGGFHLTTSFFLLFILIPAIGTTAKGTPASLYNKLTARLSSERKAPVHHFCRHAKSTITRLRSLLKRAGETTLNEDVEGFIIDLEHVCRFLKTHAL